MTSSAQQPHPAGTSLSHSRNTGRSLRLMSIILLLVFVAASTALVVTAIRLNAHASAQSSFYVKKVLEARQRQIDTTLADYAFWGDAYKHLHMQLDLVWAYERRNLGPSLYDNFGFEGVFLVGPDGDTVYAVVEGELSRLDVHQWAGGQLDGLIEHARQTADQEEVLSGFVEIGSQPALIAVAAMTHDNDPAVLPIAGPPSVLVFVDVLLPTKLGQLGKENGIEGLRTGEHAGSASLSRPTLSGKEFILTWDPPRPGDALLLVLLPLLLLASIILVVVTRATLRSSVNAARAIDAGYLAAQAYQQQLTFHAQHDPLTGLPNRSLLHERLATAQHRILTEGLEVTVMLLDLDGFKPINDTYATTLGTRFWSRLPSGCSGSRRRATPLHGLAETSSSCWSSAAPS
jgi:sensor domain CHASE-containing protein